MHACAQTLFSSHYYFAQDFAFFCSSCVHIIFSCIVQGVLASLMQHLLIEIKNVAVESVGFCHAN